MKVSLAVLIGFSFLASGRVSAQSLVYDNTRNVRTNLVYKFSREYGDEVFLGHGHRTLSSLSFQYFGEFNPTNSPNAQARLRLYLNDGPDGIMGPQTALMPKTVLFESEPVALRTGYNTVQVDLPFISVPESFTWTVHFTGLTFANNDSAGLVLSDPPTVGKALPQGRIGSFWDAWIRDDPNRTDSWSLINFGFRPGDPKASFFARIHAVPDVGTWALPETLNRGADGKVRFRVKTAPGRRFAVLVSENLRDWQEWRDLTGTGTETELVDDHPDAGNRFYWVQER